MDSSLKIMTCGNVDDGKSTLLGRLFFETNNISIDQSEYLNNRKKNDEIDYSLLLDGLLDERKQGITIDVAFKYFNLNSKPVIFIDSPGHTEYTRNTANAATFANVALVLYDLSKPFSLQTKRHLEIVSMFPNIKNIFLILNKFDKLNFKESELKKSISSVNQFINSNNLKVDYQIPISASKGVNITKKSKLTSFYKGPTILEALEGLNLKEGSYQKSSILSIQYVDKLNEKRIYLVKSNKAKLKVGTELKNLRSEVSCKVKEIYKNNKKIKEVGDGNFAISLDREIDLVKDDVLTNSDKLFFSSSFKGKLVCTSKNGVTLNRRYFIKFRHSQEYGFLHSKNNKKSLKVNEIGDFTFELENNIAFGSFKNQYSFSQFIIIDHINNETVGFGYVLHNNDKGEHVHKQVTTKYEESTNVNVLWFTGLPGSGKTTLANHLGAELKNLNIPFFIIDGDNIRKTLNQDLGFSKEDRIESNRRVSHLAKILKDSNILPIVSTISPNKESRVFAKNLIGEDKFKLIYLNTPLEICQKRDPKNLYNNNKKVNKNITGQGSNYDIPDNPNLTLDTNMLSIENCIDKILKLINN